jgi:hypothetical protein
LKRSATHAQNPNPERETSLNPRLHQMLIELVWQYIWAAQGGFFFAICHIFDRYGAIVDLLSSRVYGV